MSNSNVRARDLPPAVLASIQALVRDGEIEPGDENHIYTHIKRVQTWLSLNY